MVWSDFKWWKPNKTQKTTQIHTMETQFGTFCPLMGVPCSNHHYTLPFEPSADLQSFIPVQVLLCVSKSWCQCSQPSPDSLSAGFHRSCAMWIWCRGTCSPGWGSATSSCPRLTGLTRVRFTARPRAETKQNNTSEQTQHSQSNTDTPGPSRTTTTLLELGTRPLHVE